MLVLTRKHGERIIIGGGDSGIPEIVVVLFDSTSERAKIGIEANRSIPIRRQSAYEYYEQTGKHMLARPESPRMSTAEIHRKARESK